MMYVLRGTNDRKGGQRDGGIKDCWRKNTYRTLLTVDKNTGLDFN